MNQKKEKLNFFIKKEEQTFCFVFLVVLLCIYIYMESRKQIEKTHRDWSSMIIIIMAFKRERRDVQRIKEKSKAGLQ